VVSLFTVVLNASTYVSTREFEAVEWLKLKEKNAIQERRFAVISSFMVPQEIAILR
jgi:hypothetical protein